MSENHLPRIQTDVPSPDGRPGFLLLVPRDEVLDWDIQNEICSASRFWVRERQAWWIDAAYLQATREIVAGYTPPQPREAPPPPSAPRPRWRDRLAAIVARVARAQRPSANAS